LPLSLQILIVHNKEVEVIKKYWSLAVSQRLFLVFLILVACSLALANAVASVQAVGEPSGESILPSPFGSIQGWKLWLQPGSRSAGVNEVKLADDREYGTVFHFSRTDNRRDGGAAGLTQPLDVDVSSLGSLQVMVTGKVLYEEGGNIANINPRWYPEGAVQVRLKYINMAGAEAEWYHGFYSQAISRADEENFTRVTGKRWFVYYSPNLMELPEPPAVIKEFRVYGFGWQFESLVAQADVYASP
jgi:hypothetical protein